MYCYLAAVLIIKKRTMKKTLFTILFASATLFASAQFMVVTTINQPEGDEEWGMESFTDNMGVGFQVNDQFTVGAMANGDEDYRLFGRYNYSDEIYISVDMPMEEATDNMNLGVGYSFQVWNDLYIEPNYTMPVSEDANGKREGSFNFGLAYRF